MGRYDDVLTLKETFSDVMKALNHIILTNRITSEIGYAIGLKKYIEFFTCPTFDCSCNIMEQINITFKALQAESLDTMTALLGNALTIGIPFK